MRILRSSFIEWSLNSRCIFMGRRMLSLFPWHGDVIKWKHFPRDWPFVREIHRSPVNSPHKGQWRGCLMCVWINGWVNNCEAGDLRRHCAYYVITVMERVRLVAGFLNKSWGLSLHRDHGLCRDQVKISSDKFQPMRNICFAKEAHRNKSRQEHTYMYIWGRLFAKIKLKGDIYSLVHLYH